MKTKKFGFCPNFQTDGYSNFELPKRREIRNQLLGKNLPKRHVGTVGVDAYRIFFLVPPPPPPGWVGRSVG
jgi:hypothetical protein